MHRSAWRLGAFIAGATLVISVSVVLAATSLSHSEIAPGPEIPVLQIQFWQPSLGYAGQWIWYNFTILAVTGKLTWDDTWATVGPGAYGGTDQNTTMTLVNQTGGEAAQFTLSGWNWTVPDSAPVAVGQVVSLKVDRLLTEGDFAIGWAGPPMGSWGVGPLP